MAPSRDKLEGEAREKALADLAASEWTTHKERDAVQKTFKFKDFNEAFGFMTRVALVADKLDHHPEWFNVYNRVEVTLATHTCNSISELDVHLAKKMDSFVAK